MSDRISDEQLLRLIARHADEASKYRMTGENRAFFHEQHESALRELRERRAADKPSSGISYTKEQIAEALESAAVNMNGSAAWYKTQATRMGRGPEQDAVQIYDAFMRASEKCQRHEAILRSLAADKAQEGRCETCACGAHEWRPNYGRITDPNGTVHMRKECSGSKSGTGVSA